MINDWSLMKKLIWLKKGVMSGASEAWTTISGAIVEFITQRAHKLKSCVVNLSPKQDLHGYDSPWPAGGGVNKANLVGATPQSSTSGLTTTIDVENEIITISGTYTGSSTNASFRSFDAPNIPTDLRYKAYEITSGDHFLYTGVRFSENTAFAVDLKNLVPNAETNIQFRMVAYEGSTAPTAWTPYSNICPISGRTECEVTRTGKNLLFYYLPVSRAFGMVGSKIQDSNGGVRLSGVPTWSTETVAFRVMWAGAVKEKFNNIASVKAFCNSPYLNIRDAYFGENDTSIVVFGDAIATANNITVDIYVVVYMGEEPTEFIPYNGNSVSVTWEDDAGTVYGGTLDVVSGLLTIDRKSVLLSIFDFSQISSPENHIFRAEYLQVIPDIISHDNGSSVAYGDICDSFSYKAWSPINATDNGKFSISVPDNNRIVFIDHRFSSTADFENAVQNVRLCYKIATPITIQLTPQQITALKGYNAMWSNAGDVTVTVRGTPVELSTQQALNMLLGGAYRNNQTADDVSDEEALDIILGG